MINQSIRRIAMKEIKDLPTLTRARILDRPGSICNDLRWKSHRLNMLKSTSDPTPHTTHISLIRKGDTHIITNMNSRIPET